MQSCFSSQTEESAGTVTISCPWRRMPEWLSRSAHSTLSFCSCMLSFATHRWMDFFTSEGCALGLVSWVRTPSSAQEIITGAKNRFA